MTLGSSTTLLAAVTKLLLDDDFVSYALQLNTFSAISASQSRTDSTVDNAVAVELRKVYNELLTLVQHAQSGLLQEQTILPQYVKFLPAETWNKMGTVITEEQGAEKYELQERFSQEQIKVSKHTGFQRENCTDNAMPKMKIRGQPFYLQTTNVGDFDDINAEQVSSFSNSFDEPPGEQDEDWILGVPAETLRTSDMKPPLNAVVASTRRSTTTSSSALSSGSVDRVDVDDLARRVTQRIIADAAASKGDPAALIAPNALSQDAWLRMLEPIRLGNGGVTKREMASNRDVSQHSTTSTSSTASDTSASSHPYGAKPSCTQIIPEHAAVSNVATMDRSCATSPVCIQSTLNQPVYPIERAPVETLARFTQTVRPACSIQSVSSVSYVPEEHCYPTVSNACVQTAIQEPQHADAAEYKVAATQCALDTSTSSSSTSQGEIKLPALLAQLTVADQARIIRELLNESTEERSFKASRSSRLSEGEILAPMRELSSGAKHKPAVIEVSSDDEETGQDITELSEDRA